MMVRIDSPNKEQMELTEEQQKAHDNIVSWARGGDSDNKAALFGYAGTGKSTTVQQIAKTLKRDSNRYTICFTAPTHKAVKVLNKMAQEAGLRVDCMTTHKLLGLTLDYDHKGKAQLKRDGNADFSQYDLVVVDESSMVSQELFSYIPQQADWLFMGDSAQLPPVDDDGLLSPVFGLPNAECLTNIVRYGGSLLDHATNLRETLISKGRFKPVPYDDALLGYEGQKWINGIFTTIDLARKQGEDPDSVRVLSCTNARVNFLNKAVRTHLYGKEALPFVKNEVLMAKDSIQVMVDGKPYTLMHSCQECTIESVADSHKVIKGVKFEAWECDIMTDMGDPDTVFILKESEYQKCLAFMDQWRSTILEAPKKERGKLWGAWYKAQNDLCIILKGNKIIPRLQYAFAMTVHQSQGSTFGTVFADNDFMPWIEDKDTMIRMLYVQATRSKDKLILHKRSA